MRVKWQRDKFGFLSKFRSAAISVIERQYGREDKHELLMQTLDQIKELAKERYEIQKKARAALVAETLAKNNEDNQINQRAEQKKKGLNYV